MTGSRELNLTPHRAPTSVWERQGWDGTRQRLALSRVLVGTAGSVLAVQGIRQGTWTGRVMAGFGGSLAWWALTGEGDLSEARRRFAELLERVPWRRDDPVNESSDESFPASDAPSWTPAVGTGLRRKASEP